MLRDGNQITFSLLRNRLIGIIYKKKNEPLISIVWCLSYPLIQLVLGSEFLQTTIPLAKIRAEGLPSREEEIHLPKV
jgi:hypothetical protein